MAIPKPKHLSPEYAALFRDRSVAGAYVNHPPYSEEVFHVLDGLIQDEPRIVLDVGCGTGDLARPLAALVESVDAVDSSAAMIEIGRAREGGDQPNIRWVCQSAEDFAYDSHYSLIVCGASLHWMHWYKVIPRFAGALIDRGYLAIVGGRRIDTAPWIGNLKELISEYSTEGDFGPHYLVNELERRQLYAAAGRKRTTPQAHSMNINDYVELLHARSSLSRQRMGAHAAEEFDAAVLTLVSPYATERVLTFDVTTDIIWGRPLADTCDDRGQRQSHQ